MVYPSVKSTQSQSVQIAAQGRPRYVQRVQEGAGYGAITSDLAVRKGKEQPDAQADHPVAHRIGAVVYRARGNQSACACKTWPRS